MGNALIFSLLLIVGIFIGAVIAFIITALKKKNEEHKASNIIEKAKKDAEIGYTINEDNAIYETYPYKVRW